MSLSRRAKTLWMFIPLLFVLALTLAATQDLKRPVVQRDDCEVVGTGPLMERLKTGHNMLYSHGGSSLYDVGFRCHHLGLVMVNDQEPYARSLTAGDATTLIHRTYRFLPEQWRLEVHTR